MNISDMFIQEISSFKPGSRSIDPANLLFTAEDVAKTNHPLTRLFRHVMHELQVTHEQFNICHNNHAIQSGFLPSTIDYHRNNVKKSMKKPRITNRIFEHVLSVILGYHILDSAIQINDPKTGMTKTYKLSDTVDEKSPLARKIDLNDENCDKIPIEIPIDYEDDE